MDFIKNPGAPDTAASGGDIVFDTSSGISEEDQKDILSQIDTVAQENRISVKAETLLVQAKRRGYLFPLFVNIGAFLLLVSVFFILSAFYKSGDSDLRREVSALRSTEGRLLQELRKETTSRMREKERQIASIMARLTDIDRERQNMQSGIEARVRAREDELRRRMEGEIETEKRRLTAEGLSEPAVAERLRPFEEEKNARFNDDAAEFRRQTEAERLSLETNLQNLQKEFQENLRELQTERLRIIEYARAREETLRAQMEEKSRELNRAYERNRQELAEARDELHRLAESQERSSLIEGQINGYFNTLNKQIQDDNLEEALTTLGAMRNFLNEPAIQDYRVIRNRKESDMAVIDALGIMIGEIRQGRRENISIARALPGGTAEAPRTGEAAVPVSPEQERQDDPDAVRILRQADSYYAAGRYREAGAAYLSIAENHSSSAQRGPALEGLKKSLEAQNAALTKAGASAAAYEGITQTLREQNSSLIQTIENLQKTHQIDLQAQELRLRDELSE